jgi:hypothetical protein
VGLDLYAGTLICMAFRMPTSRDSRFNPVFTHLGVGVVVDAFQEWKGKYSNWGAVPFSTQNFGHGGICE